MAEYYMFNKPRGCITARRDSRSKTVMDYFPENKREVLFPVGRLDKDTEGLLIVTDDGALCYNLLSPDMKVEKTYYFCAIGILSEEDRQSLCLGVTPYTNKSLVTAPAKISVESVCTLRDVKGLLSGKDIALANKKGTTPVTVGKITITEGKKHQVKRMLSSVGCRVVYLKRLSISGLFLDGMLPLGEYRPLTENEINFLKIKTGGLSN